MAQCINKKIVKGLTKENIVDMYLFVNEFENNIKTMKKDSQLRDAYPNVTEIIKSNKSSFYKTVIWKKRDKINGINKGDMKLNNCVHCTLSQNTVFLSFLRHLRNSFCHDKMRIKAFYLENEYKGNIKMIGNMKKEFLLKNINSIIKK